MVIYEVYLRGSGQDGGLIGVLPERRVDRDRIDPHSVIKWSRTLFGDSIDGRNLFLVRKII